MTERFIFPSHVSTAYKYFARALPGVLVARDEPPTGWDKNTPLVLIKDGGGGRIHHYQLADKRISFEVRAPDGEAADALANHVFNVMREWPEHDAPVYLTDRHLTMPAYDPLPEPRLPAYTWTVTVTLKSTTLAT